MLYRKLGNTDIDVSVICLGTMTFGEQNSESESHEQMDYALAQGVNFFDTAEMYPVFPKAETQGRTEEIIGTWFHARKNRDKIFLASKAAGPRDDLPYIRGGARLNLTHIETALNESLQRLQSDYIDLYQIHWPERTTNCFGKLGYKVVSPKEDEIELLETLQALDVLVKSGKVRHIGISNETPWGLMQYLKYAEQYALPKIVSIQNPFSLLNRTFEIGLAEVSHFEKVGLLAYSPLAFGMLTGKYLSKEKPKDARITLWPEFSRYTKPAGIPAVTEYVELARKHNLSPAQMALAFVNSRPFLTSNIIGATNLEQLKENIDSINLELSEEVLAGIEEIHTKYPNPCP